MAIDFVPKNFRFMEALPDQFEETYAGEVSGNNAPPPPASEDFNAQRRTAMAQGIKNALRQPQMGEKCELGFIEKIECSGKGMFFHIKGGAQTFKLFATSPQTVQIRGFTPEIEQLRLGCNVKQLDIPVVFVYKENADAKTKSNGELLSLDFVPKSFVLD